jgi:hypothetical protein
MERDICISGMKIRDLHRLTNISITDGKEKQGLMLWVLRKAPSLTTICRETITISDLGR